MSAVNQSTPKLYAIMHILYYHHL